jgi:hypothetical protein
VRAEFQVELALRALFEKPTIAQLADQIAQSQVAHPELDAIAALLSRVENLSDAQAQELLAEAEQIRS